jgi:hypothetical protein
MRRHDQQRFARLVSEFIESSGIAPPLYLIAVSNSNGTVIVSRHLGSCPRAIHDTVFGIPPPQHSQTGGGGGCARKADWAWT